VTSSPAAAARYTRLAMVLHWLVAGLIILNVLVAWSADYAGDAFVRTVVDTHKSIGITVLGLAILRLLWRWANPPPAPLASLSQWERKGAHLAHLALYGLIFALPISGWMHDSAWIDAPTHPMFLFGLVPWPRIGWLQHFDPATQNWLHDALYTVHHGFAIILYALLALHIAGALKHQFWDHEPIFRRIWPTRG